MWTGWRVQTVVTGVILVVLAWGMEMTAGWGWIMGNASWDIRVGFPLVLLGVSWFLAEALLEVADRVRKPWHWCWRHGVPVNRTAEPDFCRMRGCREDELWSKERFPTRGAARVYAGGDLREMARGR